MVSQFDRNTESYNVRGVPAFLVNGKYMVKIESHFPGTVQPAGEIPAGQEGLIIPESIKKPAGANRRAFCLRRWA
jgi:hypothetical protein